MISTVSINELFLFLIATVYRVYGFAQLILGQGKSIVPKIDYDGGIRFANGECGRRVYLDQGDW